MAKVTITMDEVELRKLVLRDLNSKLGDDIDLKEKDVKIEVKSSQNYKAEWEPAHFRATYTGDI